MWDRGSRWLAAVVAALFTAQTLVGAGPPAGGPVPKQLCGGRGQISRELIEIGYTPDRAQDAASRLTAEDLEVLLAHPEMMQAAGGAQVEMTIGALLIVGLIVGLAVAGSSVVIISA